MLGTALLAKDHEDKISCSFMVSLVVVRGKIYPISKNVLFHLPHLHLRGFHQISGGLF